MKGGRYPKLTYPQLRVIDAWFSQGVRNKSPPAKTLAAQIGCSLTTLYDAAGRRGAYRDAVRG
jgi:hypothetical protein